MMPSCRIFLLCILLITLYESVDSRLSRHKGAYLCKSWKSCPLQIPLKKCSKHMSVRLAQICDGTPQCPCGDDEEHCDPICLSQFRCRNKTCIPASKICDGTPDCQDNEDEVMCPKPEPLCPGMFACLNGTCIPAQKTCDGNPDCGEQEDESMCPPPESLCPGMFACLNRTCIPANRACDNIPDCQQNEDEVDCPPAPLCRTCVYQTECFTQLPANVSESLFLSTTILPVNGIDPTILQCQVLCTLNMACKSTWTNFIIAPPNVMLICRLSDMTAVDVSTAANVTRVSVCTEQQATISTTYTQVTCQDHPAP